MRIKIKEINEKLIGQEITVKGWVRTKRDQKEFVFLEINDGSRLSNFQIVTPPLSEEITTGAAVAATGKIVKSPGNKQAVEMQADRVELIGGCDPETFPLQKKRHSFEFLRTIAHLRPRTNTFGAVSRIRSYLAQATHTFFQKRGFFYVTTPIITLSDCEGGGKMFRVSAEGEEEFFGKPSYLTVSGQLNGEAYATALSDIYTFGPTFRAENSHTSRHLAEFWMIEPEMAFADLKDNMDLAESYIKTLFKGLLEECAEDLELFEKFIKPNVIKRLENVVHSNFPRISYGEAISLLQKSGKTFEFEVKWGADLQSEHECYLSEECFKSPTFVYDYPAEIKAFYMRQNEDGKTVAAMDLLVPEVGELIGGSQREEREELLLQKMEKMGLDPTHYDWYLQLRRFGTVPHAGFGVGFERLVLFATGMANIRDVIPFPRYPGHADF